MKSHERRTAKIYQFPQQPVNQIQTGPLARLEAEAKTFASVEFGSGWYHDEAITQSQNEPAVRKK